MSKHDHNYHLAIGVRAVTGAASVAAVMATGLGGTVASASASPAAPSWQYVDCAEAAVVCDADVQTAFDRWGHNLPLLYSDSETGYVGPPLGEFADSAYGDDEVNRGALTACLTIATAADRLAGEDAWFAGQLEQYPQLAGDASHELFDAAMASVCSDLGYERAYDWTGSAAGATSVAVAVTDAAPGMPSWAYTSCDAALAGFCEASGLAPAYDLWGANLPMMYDDPATGYSGPDFGTISDDGVVDFAVYDAAILSACQHVATAKDRAHGETAWFGEHLTAFASASPDEVQALFDATMSLVCPDLSYSRSYEWTGVTS